MNKQDWTYFAFPKVKSDWDVEKAARYFFLVMLGLLAFTIVICAVTAK